MKSKLDEAEAFIKLKACLFQEDFIKLNIAKQQEELRSSLFAKALEDKYRRLRRIKEIIEQVEARSMSVDGPVTKTCDEITDTELKEIYKLTLDK